MSDLTQTLWREHARAGWSTEEKLAILVAKAKEMVADATDPQTVNEFDEGWIQAQLEYGRWMLSVING